MAEIISSDHKLSFRRPRRSKTADDDEDLDATVIDLGDHTPISSQELGMELDLRYRRMVIWASATPTMEYRNSSGLHPSRQGCLGRAGKDVHQATSWASPGTGTLV